MDGVVEIITGRERRRRWSLQDKMRIVAETNEPGSMIRAVAACQSASKRGSGSISVQIGKFARHVSGVRPCDEVHSRQSRLPVFW